MRFVPGNSKLASHTRALFSNALALAIFTSCSDSTAPVSGDAAPLGVRYVEILVPDSLKNPSGVTSSGMRSFSLGISKAVVSPVSALSSSVAAPFKYTVSRVDFSPEAAPSNRILVPNTPQGGDGYAADVPLGFSFDFYGTRHEKLNVFANGFVTFGAVDDALARASYGWYRADRIPYAGNPNKLIAFAWTDWSPQRAGPDAIRYETRGTAPNRRFILQFTNVPEYGTYSVMTVQVVLAEGSNSVTIYSPTMTVSRSDHLVTQGIENADGTVAAFDSIQNPILGVSYPRVRNFFKLSNDAVRFAQPRPPVITPPANVSVTTAPPAIAIASSSVVGACAAVVDPGVATATDDGDGVIVTGVRSDGLALDAAYPKGTTTIIWTATDADGMAANAPQTVTVSDIENPSITAPAGISADNDPGMGSAAVAAGTAVAADNCPNVSVAGARSDGAALSAPFPVGLTTITWTAKDESGNSASASQSVLVSDVEAPRISASDIELDATSRSGAVVSSFNLVFGDNVGVVQVTCKPEPGSMFRAGRTPVECTAVDAAGNSASDSFVVTVHGAAEQLIALIGSIETLDLSSGTANPLLNQLLHALSDVEDENGASCKKIEDFIRLLTERKKSTEFSPAEVSDMLADARRIQAVLGCQ